MNKLLIIVFNIGRGTLVASMTDVARGTGTVMIAHVCATQFGGNGMGIAIVTTGTAGFVTPFLATA